MTRPPNLGIDGSLRAIAIAAERAQATPEIQKIAQGVTTNATERAEKMRLIVDELHRRYTYAADHISEAVGPVPLLEGSTMDVDDACLFVAALAMSLGIRCRIVAARYERCWTCFVDYEAEDGGWVTIDPLRQRTQRAPEQWIVGLEPDDDGHLRGNG